MVHIKIDAEWIDRLLPDGFLFPSSTLISGPGGSGKPLISSLFASSWLKNGGTVTILLINSNKEYELKMLSLFGIQQQKFSRQLFFVDFDPETDTVQETSDDLLTANLVKPDIWDKVVAISQRRIGAGGPGNLLLGAALNLLLFSETYRKDIVRKIKTVLQKENCIFSVSTNIFSDEVLVLENSADNLMFARAEKPMKLFFRIDRMKDVSFLPDEVRVPLSEHELRSIRVEAEAARKHLIPIIKRI